VCAGSVAGALLAPGAAAVVPALAGACVAAGLGLLDRPREEWRWAVPLAGLLLLAGAVRLVRVPGMRSWPALTPGLVILFLPSLWVASTTGGTVRIVWLVVAGAAVVVAGAVLRLQGPLVLGAVALSVNAVILARWGDPDVAVASADQASVRSRASAGRRRRRCRGPYFRVSAAWPADSTSLPPTPSGRSGRSRRN
jgi:hypothetical protein